MLVVKMMTNREEGYKVAAYPKTVEEAQEYVRALKVYYAPIDVYYTIK